MVRILLGKCNKRFPLPGQVMGKGNAPRIGQVHNIG